MHDCRQTLLDLRMIVPSGRMPQDLPREITCKPAPSWSIASNGGEVDVLVRLRAPRNLLSLSSLCVWCLSLSLTVSGVSLSHCVWCLSLCVWCLSHCIWCLSLSLSGVSLSLCVWCLSLSVSGVSLSLTVSRPRERLFCCLLSGEEGRAHDWSWHGDIAWEGFPGATLREHQCSVPALNLNPNP